MAINAPYFIEPAITYHIGVLFLPSSVVTPYPARVITYPSPQVENKKMITLCNHRSDQFNNWQHCQKPIDTISQSDNSE